MQAPPLDAELAAPCPALPAPVVDDFDGWLTWATQVAMPAYAACKKKHARTVEAWPSAKAGVK